jgi:hypothetical protein
MLAIEQFCQSVFIKWNAWHSDIGEYNWLYIHCVEFHAAGFKPSIALGAD